MLIQIVSIRAGSPDLCMIFILPLETLYANPGHTPDYGCISHAHGLTTNAKMLAFPNMVLITMKYQDYNEHTHVQSLQATRKVSRQKNLADSCTI